MRKIYSLLLLGAFMLLGAQSAWAWTINGRVYFDNTNSDWSTANSKTIQLWGEKSNGSASMVMSSVPNTKLFYWSGSWGDGAVSTIRFANMNQSTAEDWYGASSWNRLNHDINASSTCIGMSGTWGIDVNGKSVLFVSGSGTYSSTTAVDLSSVNTYDNYSGLNSTQTIYAAVRTVDGNDYTVANSKATISITSYAMDAEGSTAKQTTSLSTSANNQTVSAARTATTTLSVGTVADGFEFIGWYTAATGGTELSTETSYTYYPTGATEVYARFRQTTYSRPDITAAGIWGTICLPVSGTIANADLYSIIGTFNNKLYLSAEETNNMTAGKPYIFKSSDATPSVTLGNTAVVATPISESSASPHPTKGLYGRYEDQSFEDWKTETVYIVRNTCIQRAKTGVGSGNYSGILANRAFIEMNKVPVLDSAPSAPSAIRFDLEEENATNIQSVEAIENAVKFIKNGQLLILKNGITYDMTGRMVE